MSTSVWKNISKTLETKNSAKDGLSQTTIYVVWNINCFSIGKIIDWQWKMLSGFINELRILKLWKDLRIHFKNLDTKKYRKLN